jgi:hypothetical protein
MLKTSGHVERRSSSYGFVVSTLGGAWSARGWLGVLAVGFYAWLTTVSFGIVVLDIVYARLIPRAATAFAEVADFLLTVDAITGLAALGAIALVWSSSTTRMLLALSVGALVLEFLAHPLLTAVLSEGSNLGSGLRVILAGAVSLLAFAGFTFLRSDP